jgi:hypothetical protein
MSDFFNDMPEEAQEGGETLVEEQMAEIEAEAYQADVDYSQVLTDILTEEESETLGDAMMRLDQARLYEMLIKHNLFEGVRANPRAVRQVQEEAKNFFMQRLQILLGMKDEPKVQLTEVKSPFNSLEVDALKDIAAKLTKGASQQVPEDDGQQIRPVTQPAKPQGLKPLSQRPTVKQPVRKPVPQRRPAPVDAQEATPRLQKKPSEMSPAELLEHNKSIPRPPRGSSNKSLPMPDADQRETMFARSSVGNDGSAIASLLQATGKIRMQAVDSVVDDNEDVNSRI